MSSERAGGGREPLCPAGAWRIAKAWESLQEGREKGRYEWIWQDQEVCENRKSKRESRQMLTNREAISAGAVNWEANRLAVEGSGGSLGTSRPDLEEW